MIFLLKKKKKIGSFKIIRGVIVYFRQTFIFYFFIVFMFVQTLTSLVLKRKFKKKKKLGTKPHTNFKIKLE